MTVARHRLPPDAESRLRASAATLRSLVLPIILAFAGSTSTLAASPSADGEALAGRLGGSFDSFVRRFGDATAVSGSYGEVFAVEGFGVAGVQFDRRVAVRPDPGDPALRVLLGAPPASLASTLDPDPADWSIAAATSRARDFLPTDVALGAPTAQDAHTLVAECRSAALERVFGVLSLGGCRVVFVTPPPRPSPSSRSR